MLSWLLNSTVKIRPLHHATFAAYVTNPTNPLKPLHFFQKWPRYFETDHVRLPQKETRSFSWTIFVTKCVRPGWMPVERSVSRIVPAPPEREAAQAGTIFVSCVVDDGMAYQTTCRWCEAAVMRFSLEIAGVRIGARRRQIGSALPLQP
jgi:hypothetical protein